VFVAGWKIFVVVMYWRDEVVVYQYVRRQKNAKLFANVWMVVEEEERMERNKKGSEQI
jgi:hypothetical protein